MYVSVVFSIFTEMCSHHHHLLLDHFYYHERNCMPNSHQLPFSPLNSCLLLLVLLFSLSRVWLFATPWTAARQASLPLSLSPWVCSNSCPLRQWCHPTISSSVAPFSSCPQFFPASRSFPISCSSNQVAKSWSFSIGPSSKLIGLISLLSKGLSGVFTHTTVWKHQFLRAFHINGIIQYVAICVWFLSLHMIF